MEDLVVVDQMVVVVLETLLNHLVLVMKVEQDSSTLVAVAVVLDHQEKMQHQVQTVVKVELEEITQQYLVQLLVKVDSLLVAVEEVPLVIHQLKVELVDLVVEVQEEENKLPRPLEKMALEEVEVEDHPKKDLTPIMMPMVVQAVQVLS